MKTTHDLDERELREAILEWAERHHQIANSDKLYVECMLPASLCDALENGTQHVSVVVYPEPVSGE